MHWEVTQRACPQPCTPLEPVALSEVILLSWYSVEQPFLTSNNNLIDMTKSLAWELNNAVHRLMESRRFKLCPWIEEASCLYCLVMFLYSLTLLAI